MPKVSVVMAAFNHGRFLPAALSSALCQTMSDLEVHVVDDGSTDDTAQAVRPFLEDGRVFYHRQKNAGQASAKNRGIASSRGDFVAFLDADDQWLPDKLERQMPLFEDETVGVVFSGRSVTDEQGRPVARPARAMYRGFVADRIFVDNFVCFSSSVVRRRCFETLGLFDETLRLSIDFDLWIRFSQYWRFDYVDAPLVKYRTGHAQLSNSAMERIRTAFSVMDRHASDPGTRAMIGRQALCDAYAMTHSTAAYTLMRLGRNREALGHILASLKEKPFQATASRQLAKWLVATTTGTVSTVFSDQASKSGQVMAGKNRG